MWRATAAPASASCTPRAAARATWDATVGLMSASSPGRRGRHETDRNGTPSSRFSHAPAPTEPLDDRGERLKREGLQASVRRLAEFGEKTRADCQRTRDDDRRRAGGYQARSAKQVPAAVARQVDVEQDHVGAKAFGEDRRGLLGGPGLVDDVAMRSKVPREDLTKSLVILDQVPPPRLPLSLADPLDGEVGPFLLPLATAERGEPRLRARGGALGRGASRRSGSRRG